MTPRTKDLRKDGPMYCMGESCIDFREREPEFAKALQDAGIIAHYQGFDSRYQQDQFSLDGITPIWRGGLERMLRERKEILK